jgi:NodT family efflux transporter outer membrane factor (OMF) lipoprotein
MVGPNFHSPAAPKVTSYTATPLPAKTVSTPNAGKSGKAQYLISNRDIPAEWWKVFHSTELNSLIQVGMENSPNLIAAKATLVQAEETLIAQIGNSLYPAFNLGLSGARQKFSDQSIGFNGSSVFNLFNASVSAAYTFDFFGAARRQIEALAAQVDYQQFQLIAAYLTLTSNIATTSITIASLEDQIVATRSLLHDQEAQLAIFKQQFNVGGIAYPNLLTQQTLVNQTRATLPPLEKSLSQSRHALAVLVGDLPNRKPPNIRLAALSLPTELPVSLPSSIVRQRPDVRAAEALLHAASAQVGVATANLFPQFTINGNFGWEASAPAFLINPSAKVWSYGGQITQPLFHGGALFATRRAAIAAFDASAAQYRQVLLQAFQNVADALRAVTEDAKTFRAQKQAETSAFHNLVITKQQYRAGGVSYLALLTAQQQYQQTRIARIQAEAARYADTAALYQALGGGWWNRTTLAACGKDPINPTNASITCPD